MRTHPADRTPAISRNAERWPPASSRRTFAFMPASRRHHRARAGARKSAIGCSCIWATPSGKIASAPRPVQCWRRFEVCGDRQTGLAARRDQFHHGARGRLRMRHAGRIDPSPHCVAGLPVVAVTGEIRARSSPNVPARASISCTSRRRGARPCVRPKAACLLSPARPARTTCCCRTDYLRGFAGVIQLNPPVREAPQSAPLCTRGQRTIDVIATDHAPQKFARGKYFRNDIGP